LTAAGRGESLAAVRALRKDRASSRFATVVAAGFGPVFALPLLLDPYRWARAFGWPEEHETDVGLYFGRCLGALATASCLQAARASRDPAAHRGYFEFAEAAGWLLAAVHLRGFLERRQPPIEHAEIAGYSAFALAARRWAPRR
jgi:hypothetical protein